jgi:hypothetical protein
MRAHVNRAMRTTHTHAHQHVRVPQSRHECGLVLKVGARLLAHCRRRQLFNLRVDACTLTTAQAEIHIPQSHCHATQP